MFKHVSSDELIVLDGSPVPLTESAKGCFVSAEAPSLFLAAVSLVWGLSRSVAVPTRGNI